MTLDHQIAATEFKAKCWQLLRRLDAGKPDDYQARPPGGARGSVLMEMEKQEQAGRHTLLKPEPV